MRTVFAKTKKDKKLFVLKEWIVKLVMLGGLNMIYFQARKKEKSKELFLREQ